MGRVLLADVAELVDALDLGSSISDVGVRFPPSVRKNSRPYGRLSYYGLFRLELVDETETQVAEINTESNVVLESVWGMECILRIVAMCKVESFHLCNY